MLWAYYNATLAVDGTSPESAHFVNWAVRQDGIRITFSQNQVVLNYKPLPSVIVPWPAVSSVMKAGPVAQLAGF